VRGNAKGNALAEDVTVEMLPDVAPLVFPSVQPVAALLVNFLDDLRVPSASVATASLATASTYLLDISGGNHSLSSQVFGVKTLPINRGSTCDYQTWMSQAILAFTGEYNPNALIAVVVPSTGACGWVGLGTVGGGRMWLNGDQSAFVWSHELGHAFLGLLHANTLACAGGSCSSQEYGSTIDVMGNTVFGRINASSMLKRYIGYLETGVNVQTVTQSGIYLLGPFERAGTLPRALVVPGVQAAVVNGVTRIGLTIEARTTQPTFSTSPGVALHLNDPALLYGPSYQLDRDRGSSGFQGFIAPGDTPWMSLDGLVSISTSRVDALGATVHVTFLGSPSPPRAVTNLRAS